MEATKPKSSTTLCSLAYREGEKILKERSEEKKKEEGQFLTPPKIARYIARKVEPLPETTRLLDPAIGSGVLPCAIIERTIERGWPKQIELAGYETDDELGRAARYVLTQAKERAADAGVDVRFDISPSDFVLEHAPNSSPSLFNQENSENEFETFDAIIANPPYFKLNRSDPQAQAVMGEVEGHTNIYTLFMGLAARMLSPEGRSCFIVPRSFCSGAYFKSFREDFLRRVLPEHVHVFVSREKAFDGDSVLQENVIFSLTARGPDEDFESVDMSTSRGVEDLVVGPTDHSRTVPASLFVGEGQKSIYYRLPSCDLDEKILELVDSWEGSFEKHRLEVSTGPVVAFRSRPLLTDYDDVYDGNALPLMWMQNIRPGTVEWPTDRRNKSQGILDNQDAEDLLVPSENYVLIRRFSSKEDRRRLTAAPFLDSGYTYDRVGFENHLNYLYREKDPLTENEARGIAALLNSALVDRYFRILNGNTQVNATDLKSLNLPPMSTIQNIGEELGENKKDSLEEVVFSTLRNSGHLNQLIPKFTETRFTMGTTLEAQDILRSLGMPEAQQNTLSALTLLALARVGQDDNWSDAEQPSLGISEMMDEMERLHDQRYAENTRESVRKNVIHQFVQGAIAERNPDDPSLPTNSPATHYALTDEALFAVRKYNTDQWEDAATNFLENQGALAEKYRQKREQERVPLELPSGEEYSLSPGEHNELQIEVIEEFGPRFAPGAQVLYVGDTENKQLHLDEKGFEEVGVPVPSHDKLPDVVLYDPDKDWLYFIEAVTSRGPINKKRQIEIEELMLGKTEAEPIFVTTFLDFSTFGEFMNNLAWETEVWIADRPGHMVHFNGDKFLGPHSE
jgi:adenine-specific DNA-methyltransferase